MPDVGCRMTDVKNKIGSRESVFFVFVGIVTLSEVEGLQSENTIKPPQVNERGKYFD